MAIKDYKRPSKTVNIPSSTGPVPVDVYGLSLDAITVLARDYAKQLSPLYQKAKDGELDEGTATDVFVTLLDEVPTLINMILYFGLRIDGEDEEEMEAVASLDAGVQLELVEAVFKMTFLSENGEGKAIEIVRRAFQQAGRLT